MSRMFPHTITVFNRESNDSYAREVIDGVYWYGERKAETSGKGIDESSFVIVIIPLEKCSGIQKESLIVKGIHSDIESISDLNHVEDCITVVSIDKSDAGTRLDHVTVKGV